MYRYSAKSLNNLSGVCEPLQRLMYKVLEEYDHSILSGYRDEEEQNTLVAEGKSQLTYPNSKHNSYPSMAVDVQPYPMKHVYDLIRFIGYVERVAFELGMEIRLGLDWEMDRDTSNNWVDAYHIEYIGTL